MFTKRFYWVCALCMLLVVAGLSWPRPGVTPANFHRLHKGMTAKEIEGIMGRPADSMVSYMQFTSMHTSMTWHGEKCCVSITCVTVIWGVKDMADIIGTTKTPGIMVTCDGRQLELRDEPPSVRFRKWVCGPVHQALKKLRGE